jgi:hypothetical protein
MLRIIGQLVPAAALLLSTALAQPNAVPEPAQAEARAAAARTYVEGPAMKDMFDQMFSNDALAAQMQAFLPQGAEVDADLLDDMMTVLSEELNAARPQMTEAMVEAAARTFTLAELEAANAFYQTPAGRGMAAKTGQFQVAVMPALLPVIQTMQEKLVLRLEKLVEENE